MRHTMILRGWWLGLLLTLSPPVVCQGDSAVVQVTRVIDGNTIEVCCVLGDCEKVRYIGTDTPDTKHPTKGVEPYGKEASEANRKLVDGKTVSLEFDVEQRDRYGRLLAYVFLEDGTFVNAWLVENGFAQVMTVPPNVKNQELFLKLQREAREARRGLWISRGSVSSTATLSLRSLAQVRGIQIGAAVEATPLKSETLYAKTLAREFSMVTPENAMKFERLHPRRDRYDFSKADAIVDFAEAHGMQVRGHTLVWHQQLPGWLEEGNWTRDELIEILREHIITVVGHYRGRVVAWDVVNEAVANDGSLRDTIWLKGIGPEYIEMALHWAHDADQRALLFYNDYAGERWGRKSAAIYALVQDLLRRGVPIHGVGLQMHLSVARYRESQGVAPNMKFLSALGLEVHITEMDVRIKNPATEEELAQQARIYRDMLKVCLSVEKCKAFVLWGFTDRHSWIPYFFTGWGTGLIFDSSYHPKPAYKAITDVLIERRK